MIASIQRSCGSPTTTASGDLVEIDISSQLLLVVRDGRVAIAGHGQVTLDHTVMKSNARKVRRLGRDGQVLAGFAGAAVGDVLGYSAAFTIGMVLSGLGCAVLVRGLDRGRGPAAITTWTRRPAPTP